MASLSHSVSSSAVANPASNFPNSLDEYNNSSKQTVKPSRSVAMSSTPPSSIHMPYLRSRLSMSANTAKESLNPLKSIDSQKLLQPSSNRSRWVDCYPISKQDFQAKEAVGNDIRSNFVAPRTSSLAKVTVLKHLILMLDVEVLIKLSSFSGFFVPRHALEEDVSVSPELYQIE